MSDDDFQAGDSGATDTYPITAGSVKKGSFIMLKGFPCKVNECSTAKVGKHGAAKTKLIGSDIFTNKTYEEISPSSHNTLAPVVKRTTYVLVDLSDTHASVLDEKTANVMEIALPDDDTGRALVERIQEMHDGGKSVSVVVLSACGREKIVETKEIQ